MSKKVAVITGGASGIGKATAILFAANNFNVVVAGILHFIFTFIFIFITSEILLIIFYYINLLHNALRYCYNDSSPLFHLPPTSFSFNLFFCKYFLLYFIFLY